ncbi:unnamed protein product [Adineta ricciae]|uniref:Uncharacterized protein n=1 Tax=Adineta ricciae TaxID=249248 RepID=A0A814R416_ADIRI|nr:unnamed protein product [Adineta ricciae]
MNVKTMNFDVQMECALQKYSGSMVGHYDCMDWSDEYNSGIGDWCWLEPDAIDCDEHLCLPPLYSCGDGQCISWNPLMAIERILDFDEDCFNMRNLNYMCELIYPQPTWTLVDGLCWPDIGYDDPRYPPWNMMNTSNLTNDEICQYLFRCALSDGFEYDCPCNKQNCTEMMINTCKYSEHLISYPPKGLINSNIIILYKYDHSLDNPSFRSFLTGNIKCRGYEFQTDVLLEFYIQKYVDDDHFINHFLCKLDNSEFGYRNISSQYQYDKFCWNNSLTFNRRPYAVNTRVCSSSKECISQYRINDGSRDCFDLEDESDVLNKSYCTGNVGRHRFQCHNNERKCLPVTKLDTKKTFFCSNRYDKSWYGNGIPLQNQLRCKPEETTDCHHIKNFQQQNLKGRMFFQSHCDTFWDSDTHIDEMSSSCQYWVCRDYQYQCRTGQCIPENWVCDGEWDCPDASDEEGFVLIEKTSKHNNRLPNFQSLLEKCREKYSKSPFSNVCNTSFEFGCYLSQVPNPLNVSLYRPCINLTQIGDRIVDCYNAYDERNTFSINSNMRRMWGLHFLCADKHLSYESACTHLLNCTDIQCSYNRDETGLCSDKNDFVCLKENQCKKNGWCNGTFDCFYGEDEYWCSSHPRVTDSTAYRYEKN